MVLPSLWWVSCVHCFIFRRVRTMIPVVLGMGRFSLRGCVFVQNIPGMVLKGLSCLSGVWIVIVSMIFVVKLIFRQRTLRVRRMRIINWDFILIILLRDLPMVLELRRGVFRVNIHIWLLMRPNITNNILWIHREAEEVLFDWHFEVFDLHNPSNFLRNFEKVDIFNIIVVNPRCDELESPVEVVNNMTISVCLLKVFNNIRLNMSWAHWNSLPFESNFHIFKPHIEINVNVLVWNWHNFLSVEFIVEHNFHIKNDAHLLIIVHKSWSSKVHEFGTQWKVIISVLSQIRHSSLHLRGGERHREVGWSKVRVRNIHAQLIVPHDDLKQLVYNFGADLELIRGRVITFIDVQISKLCEPFIFYLMVSSKILYVSVKESIDPAVADRGFSFIAHCVRNIQLRRNFNLLIHHWYNAEQSLDNSWRELPL